MTCQVHAHKSADDSKLGIVIDIPDYSQKWVKKKTKPLTPMQYEEAEILYSMLDAQGDISSVNAE